MVALCWLETKASLPLFYRLAVLAFLPRGWQSEWDQEKDIVVSVLPLP